MNRNTPRTPKEAVRVGEIFHTGRGMRVLLTKIVPGHNGILRIEGHEVGTETPIWAYLP